MAYNIERTLYSIDREEEEKQTQILAKKYRLPYIYLVNYPVLADVLYIIKPEQALNFKLVAYLKSGDTLRVATYNPKDSNIASFIKVLEEATKLKIMLSVCSETSYRYVAQLYKTFQEARTTQEGIEVSDEERTQFKEEIKNLIDLKDKITSVSTTHLLDVIFVGAEAVEASDIHLEPENEFLKIRYRIDGVLQDIAELPISSHKALISRIKYLAKLKIDVVSVPQDGRFDAKAGDQPIDIRVSTMPTNYGESVVMRLLYRSKEFITLDKLGFNQDQLTIIHEAISKPHGIIFNTGPTGSGKSTTLYAILQELNQPGVKIITLEDPIEYRIEGIEQTQVEVEKKFTFASGLRSILRHDPDIIMVGEIRDQETAEIAINAAMTGHMVLTTLHTNNAPAAIPRLIDIGVKPFLLGGSINLIIAQRLVRMICQLCKGKGCKECNNSGYKGRTVIAELLVPTVEFEQLIKGQATLREFMDMAKKSGMRTMEEDGMQKVARGITTKEEVLRVTRE